MAGVLHFGFETTRYGERLTITAPLETVTAVESANLHSGIHEGKMGKQRLYAKQISADRQNVTWGLNAKAIGRLTGSEKRRRALEAVNGFIHKLTWTSGGASVEADPLLQLMYFPGQLEFNFYAKLTKPKAPSERMQQLAAQYMVGMARDLVAFPFREPESYDQLIRAEVDLEGQGVDLACGGAHSIVCTHDDEWKPGASTFTLSGNNVELGNEPLIYLAGVVAIAHADELVTK